MGDNSSKVDDLTPEINKHIGKRMGQIRTKLSYSHAYVGRKIGRSGELVRQIENAVTGASSGTLAAIADALGVEVSYFFEGFEFKGGKVEQMNRYILKINKSMLNISTNSELTLVDDTTKPALRK